MTINGVVSSITNEATSEFNCGAADRATSRSDNRIFSETNCRVIGRAIDRVVRRSADKV